MGAGVGAGTGVDTDADADAWDSGYWGKGYGSIEKWTGQARDWRDSSCINEGLVEFCGVKWWGLTS